MPNYTKLAATAKRLIEKSGRDIILYKRSSTPADATKPWRGPTDATTATPPADPPTASTTVKAVFVEPSDSELGQLIEALELVKRRGSRFLVAATSTAVDLRQYEYIKDGDNIFSIEKVRFLKPGDVAILYDIEVKK